MSNLDYLCCVHTNLEFLANALNDKESEQIRKLVDETQKRIERDREDSERKKKSKLWE